MKDPESCYVLDARYKYEYAKEKFYVAEVETDPLFGNRISFYFNPVTRQLRSVLLFNPVSPLQINPEIVKPNGQTCTTASGHVFHVYTGEQLVPADVTPPQ